MKLDHKKYKAKLSEANKFIEIFSCVAILLAAFIIAWREYDE